VLHGDAVGLGIVTEADAVADGLVPGAPLCDTGEWEHDASAIATQINIPRTRTLRSYPSGK
jgi:hypothetical protein